MPTLLAPVSRASESSAYRQALTYLYGLAPRGIRLDLDRMNRALSLAGRPEQGLRCIHIAGSNGKGSTAVMIEAGLRAAGYRTGLYTSPHLHRFVERIRVDGRPIRESQVCDAVERLRRALSSPNAPELTFFESATWIAFECFREQKCDAVVLEVGLGGRLDATNVIDDPVLGVITTLSLEHTQYLGDTIEEIAYEKAGILKPGVPAVIGVEDLQAREVIAQRAQQVGAELAWAGSDFGARPGRRRGRLDVHDEGRITPDLRQPLPGEHQRRNVAVAVAALHRVARRGFPRVSDRAIQEGLEASRWPGRLERVGSKPPCLLDAAHNPEGAEALAGYLASLPRRGPQVLLFGAMNDKDHERMLGAFDGVVDHRVYACPDGLARAMPAEALARVRHGACHPTVIAALEHARALAGPTGRVVVAGSIFLLAEVRAAVKRVRRDPPIAM